MKTPQAMINRIENRLAHHRMSLSADDEWLFRQVLATLQESTAALRNIVETGDKMSVKYEAVHLVKLAREALRDL